MTAAATTRRKRRIAIGLLGALAFTVAWDAPAHARHHGHARSHHESSGPRESSGPHEGSGPQHAAIVVDASSGTVLQATNSDELRHPASLTKIMTLYLLFERLEAGKLRLDTLLPVSEHAAAQSPTKLGLKPGQSIAVEDAIRGLVTKSANDAAVVIAEAIGGSEHEFAEMMTQKAHALGMSRTLYRNASGLPDTEQVTTARDQALLGRVIQERFPRYYPYFATPSFTYHGMVMRNHNHLLGHVEGLDGIKTGYTQASGYNLVTSVHRHNRHIVAVVLGGATAGARDALMRSLIEEYITLASTQRPAALAEATSAKEQRRTDTADAELSATVSLPASRPPGPSGPSAHSASSAPSFPSAPSAASASDPIQPIHVKTVKVRLSSSSPGETFVPNPLMQPAERPAAQVPAEATAQTRISAEPLPASAPRTNGLAPTPRLGTATEAKGNSRDGDGTPWPTISPGAAGAPQTMHLASVSTAAPAHAAPSASGSNPMHSGWIIQVGAFEAEREARAKLSAVQAKAARLLGHADPFTEPVLKGDKTFYRARFAGLNKEAAEAVCRQLKRDDIDCLTVKN